MEFESPNHYATLGLDQWCTAAQVRAAYRALAKQFHPDAASDSLGASARMASINAAHETLRDPARRRAYDRTLAQADKSGVRSRLENNIRQDVHLRLEEFLRGTFLEVRVNDAARPTAESYSLTIPAGTAPGARFRIARNDGGHVLVRLRVSPNFRFKARGSDLRADLRISAQRAAKGGSESVAGVTGNQLPVQIPAGIRRGEILRLAAEGLPKARGGRGDLLLRVTYRPEVRIARARNR